MSAFLSSVQIEDVCKYEKERGTIWATLLPYLKLLYNPDSSFLLQESFIQELQVLGARIILTFLHSKVFSPRYHSLLVRENLVDFVVCLPWCITPSCQQPALALVSDLCANMPSVGPPSLASLAKARLAKAHFGLEKALYWSVGEIVSHLFLK